MSDDPFAEPNDTERTVIKPNPAGRRPMTPQAPPAAQPIPQAPPPQQPMGDALADPMSYGIPAQPQAPSQPAAGPAPTKSGESALSLSMTGMNRLNAAGAPLFSLISRIRNRAQHMDPDALRKSVVAEVRAFENRALQAGIEAQQVKVARYLLCATLDDVVLNTPWGGQSVWTMQSLVGTFHRETVGGDRFYDVLARLEKDPANNIELLEFLYMCLSLGFEGRLRVEQGGADRHLQIRHGLARIIRAQRGELEHDLSPHWQGVNKPYKPLSAWKAVYITAAVLATILGISYFGLSYALTGGSERTIGMLATLEAVEPPQLLRRAPPPPPPPPPPADTKTRAEVVAEFLEPEITEGIVKVFENNNTLVIRIAGSGMFASASDQLQDAFTVPLQRVAKALNDQPGPIIVVGHSDNVPIRTARFPSNMHLSLARAESVMKSIAANLDDASRLKAEGRAEKDPIADNGTAEGRATNRRIEILVVRNDAQ